MSDTVEQIRAQVAQLMAEAAPAHSSGWDWFWALAVVLLGVVGGKFLKRFVENMEQAAAVRPDGFRATLLALLLRSIYFPCVVWSCCVAAKCIALRGAWAVVRDDLVGVLLVVSISYVLYQAVELLDYWLRRLRVHAASALDNMAVPLLRKTLRSMVVLLGLVQIAQLLSDQPITSILAGLGVGGLAVALAAQDTIKNFFGSLVLFSDRPFQLGDRIVVNGEDGWVEEVGMRSTRIRTLDGHLVTIPNGELANLVIRNISNRPYIRRVANIGVTYDTPPEKVERAIKLIRAVLDEQNEKLHPDFPPLVHLSDFNDSSLNIRVIYWFTPPDYVESLKFDHAFNLQVLQRFNDEQIEFAFPTQTLYINKASSADDHWV